MTETMALLVSTIPAVLIIAAAVVLWRIEPREQAPRRLLWLFELSALVILASLIALQIFSTPVYWVAVLFVPSIVGLVILILINLPHIRQLHRSEKIALLLPALGIIAILAYYLSAPYALRETLPSFTVLVLAALLMTKRPAYWIWIPTVLLGVLWGTFNQLTSEQSLALPRTLHLVAGISWLVLPALTVAVMALLVASGLDRALSTPETPAYRAARLDGGLRLLAAGALLFIMAYSAYWASIWDQTSDGLGGLVVLLYSSIAAVACGMIMALRTSGRRRLAGVAFLIIVPVLVQVGFFRGWQVDFPALTERRAAQVASALEHFHSRENRYPSELNELVPGDMLYIPQPVMFKGETWCYQGTANAYRLAAFYHKYFGLPVSLNVYASAGDLEGQPLPCHERLADMQARYDWTHLPPVDSDAN